jgi:hypothetical protein
MASRRGDQAVEQVRVLDHIAAAERLDDALDVASALARVLHEVEVFVGSDLLDADEHGVEPDRQSGHHSESHLVNLIRYISSSKPRSFSTTFRQPFGKPAEFRASRTIETETVRKLGQT